MGPWGFGTFEDELACDWLEDLFDSDPVAFFKQCLDLDGIDYLEYLAGIGVICTAEIVHGLHDRPREGLPQAVLDWLHRYRALRVAEFLPSAISAMRRVIGPASEMRERWEDNEQWGEEWFRHNANLLRCLESDVRASKCRPSDEPIRENREGNGHHA